MEIICKDKVFGEMKYKYRWYKNEKINFLNKDFEITISARSYSQKPITKEQQDAYLNFSKNKIEYLNKITQEIKNYINTNIKELAEYWKGARKINNDKDLLDLISPKTLLFKQEGEVILLLDCIWDEENGLGVQIIPNIKIGAQDLFL